jgi:hypothetical protein
MSTLPEGHEAVLAEPRMRRRLAASGPDLPLLSSLELGGLPGAVPCARLHTRQVLWEHGAGHLAETAELLASELVTNSVQASMATGELMGVLLRLYGDRAAVVVEVLDRCPAPPLPRQNGPASESGRGLILVAALAADWGWHTPRGWPGKAVWCLVVPPRAG